MAGQLREQSLAAAGHTASTKRTQRMAGTGCGSIPLSVYAVQAPIQGVEPLRVNRLCLDVIKITLHKPAQRPDSQMTLGSVKLTNNTDHSSQHFCVLI